MEIPSNIHGFLERAVVRFAQEPFIIEGARTWSYAQLAAKALGLVDVLRARGVAPGDRVLLYMENSAEYVAAYFAVLELGAVVVPLNAALDAQTAGYIAGDTDARLWITSKRRLPTLERQGLTRTVPALAPELPEIPDGSMRAFAAYPAEKLAIILYTSGTSSRPKGVCLPHRALVANTRSILAYLKLTQADGLLVTLPFGYSYGNSLLLTHACAGGTLYISHEAAYPQRVLERLREGGITGFSTVGSYLNLLLKQENLRADAFRNLRYMTFAGESSGTADLAALHEMCPELELYVMYGQTEASARISYLPPERLMEKLGTVGIPIPGVEIRIAGPSGDAAVGEVGEILVRGENLMQGYWNNPAATAEKIRDGWLHTEDLGTFDADGFLTIVGRKSDMIKYMGHRISPLEIEAQLNRCENILESAVVEARDGDGQSMIRAFVVLREPAAGLLDVQGALKRGLPSFKRPQEIVVVEGLPKTSSGKLRRSALRGDAIQ